MKLLSTIIYGWELLLILGLVLLPILFLKRFHSDRQNLSWYVSSPASVIACWLTSLIRIPILRSRPRPLFGLRFPKRLPVSSFIRFSFSNPQCRADAPEGAISPPPVVCRATCFQVSGKRADRCWRPRRRGSADIPPARGLRFSRRPPGRDSRPRCRQNPLG